MDLFYVKNRNWQFFFFGIENSSSNQNKREFSFLLKIVKEKIGFLIKIELEENFCFYIKIINKKQKEKRKFGS